MRRELKEAGDAEGDHGRARALRESHEERIESVSELVLLWLSRVLWESHEERIESFCTAGLSGPPGPPRIS